MQHEIRSQQALNTRIIQWQLFTSTRAAQTEKVKSVLTLADRMRVKEYPGSDPRGVSTKFRSSCLSQRLLVYLYDTETRARAKHQETQIQPAHDNTTTCSPHRPRFFHSYVLQTVVFLAVCCSHRTKNRERSTAGEPCRSNMEVLQTG